MAKKWKWFEILQAKSIAVQFNPYNTATSSADNGVIAKK